MAFSIYERIIFIENGIFFFFFFWQSLTFKKKLKMLHQLLKMKGFEKFFFQFWEGFRLTSPPQNACSHSVVIELPFLNLSENSTSTNFRFASRFVPECYFFLEVTPTLLDSFIGVDGTRMSRLLDETNLSFPSK